MEFQVKGPQQSPGRGFIEKFPSLKGTAYGWLEYNRFLFGPGLSSGVFAVIFREGWRFQRFLGPFASIRQDYGVCYNGTTTLIDFCLSCFKENLFVVTTASSFCFQGWQ